MKMTAILPVILVLMLNQHLSDNVSAQNINEHSNQNNHQNKFIDIYTNYPHLEKMLQDEGYSNLFKRNISRRYNDEGDEFNFNYDDSSDNDPPNYVKINQETYTDPESHQNQKSSDRYDESSRSDTETVEYSDENTRHMPRAIDVSHVQKISRSGSSSNSKQLENNGENFFSKINTVIRSQFSKFFKFGKQNNDVTTEKQLSGGGKVKGRVPNSAGNARGPTKDKNAVKKRFLNIFTILQFENSRCQAQGGVASYEGTCYHRLECAHLGGVSMGACAKGYGVCCIFRYGCDGYTNQNVSYFECDQSTNPLPTTTPIPTTLPTTTGAPDIDPRLNMSVLLNKYQEWAYGRQISGTSTCVFTVEKRTKDVRQLRIDFLDFDTRGPTNGNCNTDRLVISGGNINNRIPVICGYNTGQHLYVDVSDVTGPIQLSAFTANPSEKRFRIRVSQIRAPCANFMNCLQYYTGASGTVQTFNYDPSPRSLGPATYYNNLNYAICIRKEPGYCTITYTNVQNGIESPFRLTNVDANGNLLIPPGQAGVEIFNCPDDYIVINGIRLCGERLNDGATNADFRVNAPVTDNSGGPFILPVRTNGNTVARGFKLFYQQNRCPNT